MKINKYIKKIKKLDACGDALKDALNYETSEGLWLGCKRGDWMLWLLRRVLDLDDEAVLRRFTLAKARCANLVIHLMKDKRSRKAVEIAESFGTGIATRDELNTAADAAYAARCAAHAAVSAAYAAADYAAATADATDAAADATDAAYAAASASAYAVSAAYAAAAYAATYAAADADYAAAAYAAAYAAADADYARNETLSKCADIVRDLYPSIEDLLERVEI